MISSGDVNKVLRKHLSPILRENGFSSVQARKAWGWHDHCVWVLTVRSVGSYFSDVTGWPPMSVCIWTSIYYDFIPFRGHTPPKLDDKGRLSPDEAYCHMRSHLNSTLDQQIYKSQLRTPAEQRRTDIWWIERDGINAPEVVENITLAFMNEGIQWFNHHNDLEACFKEIESDRDCYQKFFHALHFATQLGNNDKKKIYSELLEEEARRIGWI